MTTNKESLIGYDPLAWMNDGKEEEQPAEKQTDSKTDSHDHGAEVLEADDTAVKGIEETTQGEQGTGSADVDNSKVILDAVLNIQSVAALHTRLLDVFKDNTSIEIDASSVSAVDTASLQLLVVLKQEAIKEDKELVFDFPSDKFIEAARLLDIDKILGVDQAAAGFF